MMVTSVVTTWIYLVASAVALVSGDAGATVAGTVVLTYVLVRAFTRRRHSTTASTGVGPAVLVKAGT